MTAAPTSSLLHLNLESSVASPGQPQNLPSFRPLPARHRELWRPFLFSLVLGVLLTVANLFAAPEPASAFDAANKLYEQGRYTEAAASYEQLLQTHPRLETLYFNLGNAWFKAGQLGRAIAAWRHGQQLAPRDPGVRFNLQFARKKVSGSDAPLGSAWQRTLRSLTLNEWTLIAAGAIWLWFVLLALREIRPRLRQALSGYTATAGAIALLLVACVVAASVQAQSVHGVVIVSEAIARSGPLEEAKVLHQFRDGVELMVIDQKEFSLGNQKQLWLQVRDGAHRVGWVKSDQVVLLKQSDTDVPKT